jgi:malate dehydrogenase
MYARSAARLLSAQTRAFSTSSARQTKVAVLGAGGGIGQPLSLLLKIDPLVSSLSLYDIRGAPGVAADVSHIDTDSAVCCIVSASPTHVNSRLHPLLGQRLYC